MRQPNLAEEVHVALILNVLCGFTVREIASAFVSSEAAIEKRSVVAVLDPRDWFEFDHEPEEAVAYLRAAGGA